jgi:uncharacterized protein (UPF0276 family)
MSQQQDPPRRPFLGFGVGLRPEHYTSILDDRPPVDWFEVLSENYMVPGGRPLHFLDRVREHYPVVMHGVSLSIGSTDPLDQEYLAGLKDLAQRIDPVWISDHLCWTGVDGINLHDLMPLPYTEEALRHVVERISRVQDYLGCRILIENVSTYVTYRESQLTEWEFLSNVAREADCLLLLDINNIYVSACNHGFDPREYLSAVPGDRVYQHHLAGHCKQGDIIIDTHDSPVISPVWDLYREAVKRFGSVSVMIERDDDMPPFADLLEELQQARAIHDSVLETAARECTT